MLLLMRYTLLTVEYFMVQPQRGICVPAQQQLGMVCHQSLTHTDPARIKYIA